MKIHANWKLLLDYFCETVLTFCIGADIKDCKKGICGELGHCQMVFLSCSSSCSVICCADVGDEVPSEMERLRGLRIAVTAVVTLCSGTHLRKLTGKC